MDSLPVDTALNDSSNEKYVGGISKDLTES